MRMIALANRAAAPFSAKVGPKANLCHGGGVRGLGRHVHVAAGFGITCAGIDGGRLGLSRAALIATALGASLVTAARIGIDDLAAALTGIDGGILGAALVTLAAALAALGVLLYGFRDRTLSDEAREALIFGGPERR